LDTFFIKEQDVYRHKRCDDVLNKIYATSEQARLAAQARWAKRANAMQPQSERNADALNNNANVIKIDATHNPIPITHINKYIDRFDEFWKAYPRKVSKGAAEKAWNKIKPNDETVTLMIKAISAQKLSEVEEKFIPYPASWLNATKWLDEVKSAQKPLMGWK
jgi:hypothetical protein